MKLLEGARKMNPTNALIFLVMIAALGVAIWGLIGRRRSALIGVIAAAVALLAAVGGWYAWVETKSTPQTVGFGVVVIASLASAARQFASIGSSSR
jgi:hypothetical protein